MTFPIALCLIFSTLLAPALDAEVAPASSSELPRYDARGPNAQVEQPLGSEVESSTAGASKLRNQRSVAVGATLIGIGVLVLAGGIGLVALAYTEGDACKDMSSCSFGCSKTEGRCDDTPMRLGAVVGGVTVIFGSAGLMIGGSAAILKGTRRAQLSLAPTGMALRF